MVYGYARVSTAAQANDGYSLEAQVGALCHAGAVRIFSDVYSGKSKHRPLCVAVAAIPLRPA